MMADLTRGTKRKRASNDSDPDVLPSEDNEPPLMTLQEYLASKPRKDLPQYALRK